MPGHSSQTAGDSPGCAGRAVAIIGGGIIGLSSALELAAAGFDVQVFERGSPTSRPASWAGGGILSALPPGQIPPGLESLLEESLELYPQFCRQLHDSTGIDPEYWRCGANVHHADGRISHVPELAQVRNPRLLRALRAALQARGVLIHQGVEALGIEPRTDSPLGIRTAQGRFDCDQAVICAGAWSAAWGADGLEPVKGQMLLLRGRPGELERMQISDAAYLIPRRDGRILVGSTLEQAGYDTLPTAQARAWLLDQVRQLAPGLERLPVEDHWAGLRPRPAGDLPLIGRDPVKQGLYWNTGHYRLGITLAPASARRLREVMLAG